MTDPQFHLLLPRAEKAGPCRMPFAADLALEEASESLDYPFLRVDLSQVTDRDGFLDAIGKALSFPDWYGHNWDALADCLTDMSWLAADGYVIALESADGFAKAQPTDFAMALSIFQDAADTWREDGVAFWTLVGAADETAPWLRDLA